MLAAIIGVLSGAIVLIIDSRKKNHEKEVAAINSFIEEWEAIYEPKVRNWKVTLASVGNSNALNVSYTRDFDYVYGDINEYSIVKFYAQKASGVFRSATETRVNSGTNGNLNVTADLVLRI